MGTSRIFAVLVLMLLGACHKPVPPPLPSAPRPPPTLASRGPRQAQPLVALPPAARLQWPHPPATYKLKFENVPASVKAREDISFLVRVTSSDGAPASDLPNTLVVGIKSGPKGVISFRSGLTVAKIVNGQAIYSGMQLDLPGDYVFEANLSGNKVESGTLHVSESKLEPKAIVGAGPAHTVSIQLNGSTLKAHYEPPGRYTLSSGDTYENVPYGESKTFIEGKVYSVTRGKNDNLIVKPLGDASEEQRQEVQFSLHPETAPKAPAVPPSNGGR